MNILLVEDISLKADIINAFVKEKYPQSTVDICKSYQNGLKSIFANIYKFILLDMSLPTFDIKSGESGYKFRKLAGIDILKELKRKHHKVKVIIVTQWTTFERDDKIVYLSDLEKEMSESFIENYIGTVFYSSMETQWQDELNLLLDSIN